MTSTSATPSTSTSTSTAASSDYDVFINHRGPDVKRTFASDLYHRLLSYGIRVFLDQPEMKPGEYITAQIEGAIRSATVHVAIFSRGYADSRWCLDELVLMLESKTPIIPVFYDLEPADLRRKLGTKRSYAEALEEHKLRYEPSTIEKWRNGLSQVAGISGFVHDANSDEGELLRKVVEKVVERVKTPALLFEVAKYPIGLDNKIEDIKNTVLEQLQHSEKPPILGIVGLGGVGKTTLAQELFNRKNSIYSKSCFLSDVKQNKGCLVSLQKKLLKCLNVSNDIIERVDCVSQGIRLLRTHLSSVSALVVIDDVDHGDQVDALLPYPTSDSLTSDSLVVITSRNKDVLRSAGVEESSIYNLTGLTTKHSFELFCWHSFNQPHPLPEFESLVDKFVEACGGLPLSLKVFGALLKRQHTSYWESQLGRLQRTLHEEIKERLQISYDALHAEEQEIFLDIACFFIQEDRDMVIRIWDGGVCGFQNLQSKCLVEVDDQNKIKMHDHLIDLGREIAKGPKLPLRLWRWTDNDIDDSLQLLSVSDAQRIPVRGIGMRLDPIYRSVVLNYTSIDSVAMNGIRTRMLQFLDTVEDKCMRTLQFLDTEEVFVERILAKVQSPNLFWLRWKYCPHSSLPPSISLKNLKVLHVHGFELETLWENESQAPLQLRELDVKAPLSNIPESIGKLQHLERIAIGPSNYHLNRFNNLTNVPEEFCLLRSLKVLVLKSWSLMKSLPKRFGNLSNLQHIDLSDCFALERLPDSFGNLSNLQHIDLSNCSALERLPDSFGNLSNLQHIDLSDCSALERLPDTFCKLIKLKYLNLFRCSNLTMSSEALGNIISLKYINLSFCSKIEVFSQQVAHMRSLEQLHLLSTNVKELPSAIGELSFLEVVKVGSRLLDTLPPSLCDLSNLKELVLWRCHGLKCLPPSLGDLKNLKNLSISECKELKCLPASIGRLRQLTELSICECTELKCLPSSIGGLSQLTELTVYECQLVGELPFKREVTGERETLSELESSILPRLQKLEVFETGISEVSFAQGVCFNLRHLSIRQCNNLVEIGTIPNTVIELSFSGCHNLRKIDQIYGLAKLELLDLGDCTVLEELPRIETLVSLNRLNARGCPKLKSIRGLGLEYLAKLRILDIGGCSELEEVKCIQHCVSLHDLDVSGCVKLKSIQGLGQLAELRYLSIKGCSELEELEGIQDCMSLLYLYGIECPKLRWRAGVVKQLRERGISLDIYEEESTRSGLCNQSWARCCCIL